MGIANIFLCALGLLLNLHRRSDRQSSAVTHNASVLIDDLTGVLAFIRCLHRGDRVAWLIAAHGSAVAPPEIMQRTTSATGGYVKYFRFSQIGDAPLGLFGDCQ